MPAARRGNARCRHSVLVVLLLFGILGGHVTHAGAEIYCACTTGQLKKCEDWGATPICQWSHFEIGGSVGDLAVVRNVRWFQDEQGTLPFPNATANLRTAFPYPMSPRGRFTVDINTLRRTASDPIGYKFVSAQITLTDGGVAFTKAKFMWELGLGPGPGIVDGLDGIVRTYPGRQCPVVTGSLSSCTVTAANTNWPGTTSWSTFQTRLNSQCSGTTLTITQSLAFQGMDSLSNPLRIRRSGIRIVTSPGVTVAISFGAFEGGCGVQIFGSNVELQGFVFIGKAGLCVCGAASQTPGVRLINNRFQGSFANLKIDAFARVDALTDNSCELGMEDMCVINMGNVTTFARNRFQNGAKDGAVINFGNIGAFEDNRFIGMNSGGSVECVDAAAVVVNNLGANITTFHRNRFSTPVDGRCFWNEGFININGAHVNAIEGNVFSDFRYGGIVNGPGGVIRGRIVRNTFTNGWGGEGAAICNYGVMHGRIERNTFTNIGSSAAGVIANIVTSDEGLSCFGVGKTAPGKMWAGIINNTFSGFSSGDGCGAVINGDGATMGDFDGVWDAIQDATWTPPPGFMSGIMHNTFTGGLASDSGGGICNQGRISMIAHNRLDGMGTSDSGGGIFVSGSAAYVGNNLITNTNVGDLGGGVYCDQPGYDHLIGPYRAVIKMIKDNTIRGVTTAGEGGCIYGTATCAVQYLRGNRCSQISGTSAGLEPIEVCDPGEVCVPEAPELAFMTGPIVFEGPEPPDPFDPEPVEAPEPLDPIEPCIPEPGDPCLPPSPLPEILGPQFPFSIVCNSAFNRVNGAVLSLPVIGLQTYSNSCPFTSGRYNRTRVKMGAF